MKLTITGCGSGLPVTGKNLSSILLNYNRQNILIDCGEPVARILTEYSYGTNELDAIVITHFHPDHSSGIYMVLQLFHINNRKKKLKIFLPENISFFRKSLRMFYLFEEKLTFPLEFFNLSNLPEHYPQTAVYENDHIKKYRNLTDDQALMHSFSIMVSGEKKLLYTSDTETIHPIRTAIEQAEIIIIDALHPSPEQVWELVRSNKRIILTHGLRKELSVNITELERSGAVIAYDGMEIIF